jgi:tRNA threonylcarbamoyladenosine biosynthesis protein TsaE
MKLIAQSENDLAAIASKIIEYAGARKIWLLHGTLGAGKTTLVKAIGEHLQVIDDMSSPTYSIVNEYTTESGDTIYHIDCYRLKNEIEAMDIGMEEYLDAEKYCFIEWPEKIEPLWPEEYLRIEIVTEVQEARIINITSV